jgi:hypothetical protein
MTAQQIGSTFDHYTHDLHVPQPVYGIIAVFSPAVLTNWCAP